MFTPIKDSDNYNDKAPPKKASLFGSVETGFLQLAGHGLAFSGSGKATCSCCNSTLAMEFWRSFGRFSFFSTTLI